MSVISIIDDDKSVRESLQSLIRSFGFSVKVFGSAEEFLNLDDHLNTDCLILDVRMPGMDGFELHRHLVANHFDKPIIFITAHLSDDEMRPHTSTNCAVSYLLKPLSEETLMKAIHEALESSDHERR